MEVSASSGSVGFTHEPAGAVVEIAWQNRDRAESCRGPGILFGTQFTSGIFNRTQGNHAYAEGEARGKEPVMFRQMLVLAGLAAAGCSASADFNPVGQNHQDLSACRR